MIKILENSIDFSKLGNHTKEELKSEVKRAVILQESKVLELEMDLNFCAACRRSGSVQEKSCGTAAGH